VVDLNWWAYCWARKAESFFAVFSAKLDVVLLAMGPLYTVAAHRTVPCLSTSRIGRYMARYTISLADTTL
jgi:hypothetical protein